MKNIKHKKSQLNSPKYTQFMNPIRLWRNKSKSNKSKIQLK